MTDKNAEELGYTNRGVMYGFIPVFVNELIDGAHVIAKNKFWDVILDISLFVDRLIKYSGEDYFIVVKDKI